MYVYMYIFIYTTASLVMILPFAMFEVLQRRKTATQVASFFLFVFLKKREHPEGFEGLYLKAKARIWP